MAKDCPVAAIYGEPMDHVVVVGAGIGGLAASLVLSRAKQVTLIERTNDPAEVGAGLALQANGMAVLTRLGLLPSVEGVGARIDRMDIRNAAGKVLLTAKMLDFGGGLDHAVAVRRTRLHQLLLDDAAHAMAPNLGQGANSALTDAVALAEALVTERSVQSALGRYDHRRRPAARPIQDNGLCAVDDWHQRIARTVYLIG